MSIKMTMDSIQKSVASSIANSEPTAVPSHLHEGDYNDTQPLTGKQSNTTDGASDEISAGSSAPGPFSSNSSLPMLEAGMKATKISLRSCLKPAGPGPGADGNAKPTKRASFVSDDTLVKCMVTGAHTLPNVYSKERYEEFVIRAYEVSKQIEAAKEARRLNREAGIENSGSDSDSDSGSDSEDANNTYLLFAASEESHDDDEWDGPYARMLQSRLHEADAAREKLNMGAIASGAIDFALYVTRDHYLLSGLEAIVHKYRLAVQVGSYHGDERRPSLDRGYAVTQLPAALYQDYHTAMSGIRWPLVTLSMPVVAHHWG